MVVGFFQRGGHGLNIPPHRAGDGTEELLIEVCHQGVGGCGVIPHQLGGNIPGRRAAGPLIRGLDSPPCNPQLLTERHLATDPPDHEERQTRVG